MQKLKKWNLVSASLLVLISILSGCSSEASKFPQDLGSALVIREGVSGGTVSVPSSWVLEGSDGGGSGSMSTWINPSNKNEWVAFTAGMSLSLWYVGDNVADIDPSGLLPDSAIINRVDAKIFEFSYPGKEAYPKSPYEIQGVFIAELDDEGYPLDYLMLEISTLNKGLAKEIIAAKEPSLQ